MLEVRVVRAGFQQQHRAMGVVRQARRDHATRRTCSDDDDIVLHPFLSQVRFPSTSERAGYRTGGHIIQPRRPLFRSRSRCPWPVVT